MIGKGVVLVKDVRWTLQIHLNFFFSLKTTTEHLISVESSLGELDTSVNEIQRMVGNHMTHQFEQFTLEQQYR